MNPPSTLKSWPDAELGVFAVNDVTSWTEQSRGVVEIDSTRRAVSAESRHIIKPSIRKFLTVTARKP